MNRSKLSAIEQLVFFCENDSDAAPNTATSCAPAATAASKPFMFGVNTGYTTPGLRRSPASTSALSAICGIHFGDTNAVASIAGKPAAARRSINSILIAVGTDARSLWSPSRGPTSTIFTLPGRPIRLRSQIRSRPPTRFAFFEKRGDALFGFRGRARFGDALRGVLDQDIAY